MTIQLVSIRQRKIPTHSPEAQIIQRYVERAARYIPVSTQELPSEQALLDALERAAKRTAPMLVLADSKGKLLTSEEFAESLKKIIDSGTQQMFLAIGPADGWSSIALKRADMLLSFGRITLPHELAAAVAAEQVYRAITIMLGHPYHAGHA